MTEIYPETELVTTNVSGDPLFLQNNDTTDFYDPDEPNDGWDARWGMQDPEATLDGQQEVEIYFELINGGGAEFTLELYENGAQVDTLADTEALNSDPTTRTFNFDAAQITNPADVEFRVDVARGGGMPGTRPNARLGYITWNASLATFVDATTLEPSDITADAVTLNGEVDWSGDSLDVHFDLRPVGINDWTEFGNETYTTTGTIQHDYRLEGLDENQQFEARFVANRDGEEEDVAGIQRFWTKRLFEGTVTVDGDPQSNATVYVTYVDTADPENSEVRAEVQTDGGGEWSAEVPGGDEYHVSAQYDDGTDEHHGESQPDI